MMVDSSVAYVVEMIQFYFPPLLLAIVLAGVLGLERQMTGHPAGLRTHILVCLGATLMMLVTDIIVPSEKARVAAGVITGIGFLGAGTIFNIGNIRTGLTTAAMIWFVAVLGIVVGAGAYFVALIATVFALVVVHGFDLLERKLPMAERYTMTIRLRDGLKNISAIKLVLREARYTVTTSRIKLFECGNYTDITLDLWGRGGPGIEELLARLQAKFPNAESIVFER